MPTELNEQDVFSSPERIEEREKQAHDEAFLNLKTNALTEPLPPFEIQDNAVIQGEVVIDEKGDAKVVDGAGATAKSDADAKKAESFVSADTTSGKAGATISEMSEDKAAPSLSLTKVEDTFRGEKEHV